MPIMSRKLFTVLLTGVYQEGQANANDLVSGLFPL